MAVKYGYRLDTTSEPIIFVEGSEASKPRADEKAEGYIVSSTEWGLIEEEQARRICAALQYFSETDTEEIERLANEKFPNL